jgi:hypothetical protein
MKVNCKNRKCIFNEGGYCSQYVLFINHRGTCEDISYFLGISK